MYPCSYTIRWPRASNLLLLLLSGTACHAWHVEGVAPASVLGTRQPAKIRVTRMDGSQILLEHPVLRRDTLLGTVSGQRGQEDLRIPLTDVRQLATRGFSVGRTVGLGVGVAAGLFGAFLATYAIICRHGGYDDCAN